MILNLSLDKDIRKLIDFLLKNKEQSVEVKIYKETRTDKQGRSIWLYCTLLADALNDSGQYMTMDFFKTTAQVDWTKNSIMEIMWRPVQVALFSIKSTTKLKTHQVSEVFENINRLTGENFGVSLQFPDKNYGEYQ